MGSRAISYQVPEYRERSTKGTVVRGSRCAISAHAAAARRTLPIPSDWSVRMKDLRKSVTGYDMGDTASTGMGRYKPPKAACLFFFAFYLPSNGVTRP